MMNLGRTIMRISINAILILIRNANSVQREGSDRERRVSAGALVEKSDARSNGFLELRLHAKVRGSNAFNAIGTVSAAIWMTPANTAVRLKAAGEELASIQISCRPFTLVPIIPPNIRPWNSSSAERTSTHCVGKPGGWKIATPTWEVKEDMV